MFDFLLLLLLIMHDLPQLPDQLSQGLHVVVPPLQQLITEAGDVLFDLFQFPCGAVSEPNQITFLLFCDPNATSRVLLNVPSFTSPLSLSVWAFNMYLLMRQFMTFCNKQ